MRKPVGEPYVRAGERYGDWLVLEDGMRRRDRVSCRCQCGKECMVFAENMKSGRSRSCGCWKSPRIGQHMKRHGLSAHPLYHTWRHMVIRCTDPTNRRYIDYGARGIAVVSRWLGSDGLANFIEDMGPRPSPKHSLDRINNDKGYAPDNCRWATTEEQRSNRRPQIRNATYIELLAENSRLRQRIRELEAALP